MREAQFLKENADKWKQYEMELEQPHNPDRLADNFIDLTDDVAYSRTFYPKSKTSKYLNGLAASFHQKIYKNKKEQRSRIWNFWQFELPYLFGFYRRQFAYAFLFFLVFCAIGALSAKYDENFIRLILGDGYVNMTNENIERGDPFGVYKKGDSLNMFSMIAFNNIRVAFIAYMLGATFGIGTLWLLLSNGMMLGSFQYYFFSKGLGFKSITVIFIHGTLEIWSIVIAGAAGLILGNSLLFPGTYARGVSLVKGGRDGLKIVFGLIPFFITAAFLEGFVTRYDRMPLWLSLSILGASLLFITWYFFLYPIWLHRQIASSNKQIKPVTSNQNFTAWLNQKLSSEK
ncbi:stage II sporulation protein M [Segetibacter sp. 3557_3]|uniref:stage II sporulation protein M n=1 Tax=Segetibacter sp. 3557_3 TaxID=2547429 RepID=UPI001058C40E|nr:stage II sporulation protein M [Segetibacter sp. 3557_3]TDH28765.1 stage II sporulation protein M [Segetibacter sp. 3557_3]